MDSRIITATAAALAASLLVAAPAEARHWRHYHGHGGGAAAAGIAGFAAGALLRGALASQPRYYAPPPRYYVEDDAIAYCEARFRSYDPVSGTNPGYDAVILARERKDAHSAARRTLPACLRLFDAWPSDRHAPVFESFPRGRLPRLYCL